MDCPYYEQLQYAGDTRIQALVSLYTAGDARLMKNAIAHLNDSRTAEGATMSRAPTRQQQYIPPFSLWWIGMVHDYYMYVDDAAFVREMLPGVRAVLQFFAARQKANGSLGPLPWWNYVDWTTEWRSGVPPRDADGSSAPLDLQLLLAYDWAARLEADLGSKAMAAEYAAAAVARSARRSDRSTGTRAGASSPTRLRGSSSRSTPTCWPCWLASRRATRRATSSRASSPTRPSSSARTTSATTCTRPSTWSARATATSDCSANGSRCCRAGLTTFAERYEQPGNPSRSDCHAWSSSPNFEIFRTVLGIDTAAPGFQRVRVRPFLGALERVSGSIPHPKGEISVTLERAGASLRAQRSRCRAGVTGEFSWSGDPAPARAGSERVHRGGGASDHGGRAMTWPSVRVLAATSPPARSSLACLWPVDCERPGRGGRAGCAAEHPVDLRRGSQPRPGRLR